MFVLPNPLTQDDDEDNEVEVMTDLEIDHIVENIVSFLSVKLNAKLRS